jgi:predicted metal-dependent hydrolase
VKYQIGSLAIPYSVTESSRAKLKKLILTATELEVRVPQGTSENDILCFLGSKERWLIETWDDLQRQTSVAALPQRFASGAKIMLWGRMINIHTIAQEKNLDELKLRDKVLFSLHQKLELAIKKFITFYGQKISLPKEFFITHCEDKWGYCTQEGKISIHAQLIHCPKSVLEYVVVHELCHLIERSHNEKFWGLVKQALPDYEIRKKWIESCGKRFL